MAGVRLPGINSWFRWIPLNFRALGTREGVELRIVFLGVALKVSGASISSLSSYVCRPPRQDGAAIFWSGASAGAQIRLEGARESSTFDTSWSIGAYSAPSTLSLAAQYFGLISEVLRLNLQPSLHVRAISTFTDRKFRPQSTVITAVGLA